jgi:hypothetical protein
MFTSVNYRHIETCRKCGCTQIGMKYDASLDQLRRTCGRCGFGWNEAPLDRKDSDEVRAFLGNK